MEQERYILPIKAAGSDQLIIELYSQEHIDASARANIDQQLTSLLPQGKELKILILGPRCGLIAQVLLPFSSHLDLVDEEPYTTLLEERFCKNRAIEYFFGKQGLLGEKCIAPKLNIGNTQVRVISVQQFCSQTHNFYDVVVLQNCIITDKLNLVKELIKVDHQRLITMLVPGRILNKPFFPFIARLEKEVLHQFYDSIFHQQVQYKRAITGRRSEIVYYEVFGWKRKDNLKETLTQIGHILQEAQKSINSAEEVAANPVNYYESQEIVDAYINFHYGPENLGVQNFPAACAKACIEQAKKHNINGRALDLGCAIGRTSIDLAEHFEEVIGLDFSSAFIKAAQEALADKYEQISHRVKFVVGDACNLQPALGKFSLIFGGNLIDRLPDPAAFLNSVGSFLEANGILILTSPYSWLQEYTPKEKWVGGFIQNGKEVTTNEGLARILGANGFEQLCTPEDIRFSIKDNDWVYQYTLACATFWIKK